MHTLGDAPIEQRYISKMNRLGRIIDAILNPNSQRTTGFVLLVYPLNDHAGRCNYISNSKREDVAILLREQLRRFEGMPSPTGHS